MIPFALPGLEAAINRYLRLDPETLARIQTLQGKMIKIVLTDWSWQFFMIPREDGFELADLPESTPADTTISGNIRSFCKVGLNRGKTSTLFKSNITISGDNELGENLRDILQKMDVDWEEHLSHYVGDTLAHKFSQGFSRLHDIGKHVVDTLTLNLKEYVHHEAQVIPTQAEVEQFIHDVGLLRDDVERLETRIQRLTPSE